MFETFEEDGVHLVRGTVFVVAVLDREGLTLKGYLPNVLATEEDADALLSHMDQDRSLAYIVQEKTVQSEIHRSEP